MTPITLEYLRSIKPQILALAERCAVENIRVFGSVARGEATEKSDVDFLVLPQPSRYPLGIIAFKQDMEAMLGHKVDVMSDRAINTLLRERVLSEATPL